MTLARRWLLAGTILVAASCATTPSGPHRNLSPQLCLDPGFHCVEDTECCSGRCVGDDPDFSRCG